MLCIYTGATNSYFADGGGVVTAAFFLLGPAAQFPRTSTTLSGTSPKYQTTTRLIEQKIRRMQQIMTIVTADFPEEPGPPKEFMKGGIILGIILGNRLGIIGIP